MQAASGFQRVPESSALRSIPVRTHVHDAGGDSGMADDQAVAERGVLTAPAGTWDLAVRRAGVIRELAAQPVVGTGAADAAAAELGVSRRQVYLLVSRWRSGEGLVSDLCLALPAVAAAAGGCRTR